MKVCYILTGVSGSGKSTLVKSLKEKSNTDIKVASADNYWTYEGGLHEFDLSKLGEAHNQCFSAFKWFIDIDADIIVDNTNTKESEFARYRDYAQEHGYIVHHLVVVHVSDDQKNVHNVPETALRRQASNIIGTLENKFRMLIKGNL